MQMVVQVIYRLAADWVIGAATGRTVEILYRFQIRERSLQFRIASEQRLHLPHCYDGLTRIKSITSSSLKAWAYESISNDDVELLADVSLGIEYKASRYIEPGWEVGPKKPPNDLFSPSSEFARMVNHSLSKISPHSLSGTGKEVLEREVLHNNQSSFTLTGSGWFVCSVCARSGLCTRHRAGFLENSIAGEWYRKRNVLCFYLTVVFPSWCQRCRYGVG